MVKNGYFITEEARINFKKWLLEKHLTVNKFAKGCGCSRQYLEQILAGKKKITTSIHLSPIQKVQQSIQLLVLST